MTTLFELLTPEEVAQVTNQKHGFMPDVLKEFQELTIKELSAIGLLLIGTKYGNKVPRVIIPAEAIVILTNRARKSGKSLYK